MAVRRPPRDDPKQPNLKSIVAGATAGPRSPSCRLSLLLNTKPERASNQTEETLPDATREGLCGSRATRLAILASAVSLRIDDFGRLPIKWNAKEKLRPV
jgi:hypothetical protein